MNRDRLLLAAVDDLERMHAQRSVFLMHIGFYANRSVKVSSDLICSPIWKRSIAHSAEISSIRSTFFPMQVPLSTMT